MALCHPFNLFLKLDLLTLRRMGAAILESRDTAATKWLQIVAPLFPPLLGKSVVVFFSAFYCNFFSCYVKCRLTLILCYLTACHHYVYNLRTLFYNSLRLFATLIQCRLLVLFAQKESLKEGKKLHGKLESLLLGISERTIYSSHFNQTSLV